MSDLSKYIKDHPLATLIIGAVMGGGSGFVGGMLNGDSDTNKVDNYYHHDIHSMYRDIDELKDGQKDLKEDLKDLRQDVYGY